MVDDLDDLGGVKAVGGLQGLVVVDEDDRLALGKGLDQTRCLDAVLAQDPLCLRRKTAQTARLVDGVGTGALGQLVFQVRIANSCADGIVVGVLVTEHQDGCRHVIAPSLAGLRPALHRPTLFGEAFAKDATPTIYYNLAYRACPKP